MPSGQATSGSEFDANAGNEGLEKWGYFWL